MRADCLTPGGCSHLARVLAFEASQFVWKCATCRLPVGDQPTAGGCAHASRIQAFYQGQMGAQCTTCGKWLGTKGGKR